MEGLLPVVVKAVDSAMKRDSASGDSFDVAIINQKCPHDFKVFARYYQKKRARVLPPSQNL